MGNTVGSLTQLQKSILTGTVLGDGYLRKMNGRKNAFLEVNHSYTQRDYVDWKYNMLKNVVVSKPKERKSNGRRIAYRFFTKQLPECTELLEVFYQKGKKIIPANIKLNPVVLAVWFMDDGSWCRSSDVYLNTQQFAPEDQEQLLTMLKNIGLEARLNKDKEYHRIRFMKSSVEELQRILIPHLIPSMRYKIGL
jgi:hypothetical protein